MCPGQRPRWLPAAACLRNGAERSRHAGHAPPQEYPARPLLFRARHARSRRRRRAGSVQPRSGYGKRNAARPPSPRYSRWSGVTRGGAPVRARTPRAAVVGAPPRFVPTARSGRPDHRPSVPPPVRSRCDTPPRMRLPETRQMPAPASARCGRTRSGESASPLALGDEQIPLPALGADVGRIGWIVLDLLAQTVAPHIDATVERVALKAAE